MPKKKQRHNAIVEAPALENRNRTRHVTIVHCKTTSTTFYENFYDILGLIVTVREAQYFRMINFHDVFFYQIIYKQILPVSQLPFFVVVHNTDKLSVW